MYEYETQDTGELHLVLAAFNGELNIEILVEFIDRMIDYEREKADHPLLVDISGVSQNSVDWNDLKSILGYVRKNGNRRGKMALVTGEDTSRYMFLKLYVELAKLFRPDRQNAFKARRDALE